MTEKKVADLILTEQQETDLMRCLLGSLKVPETGARIGPKVVEDIQLSGRGIGREPEMVWLSMPPHGQRPREVPENPEET